MPIDAAAHPTAVRLQAFRDGLLPEVEARVLEDHVTACAVCQATLDALPEDDLVLRCRLAGPVVNSPTPAPSDTGALGGAVHPSADVVPAELADHPRYLVLGAVGAGGMGAVYMARHKVMERVVALKILSGRLTHNPASVERFRREARAAAQLAHPNIVIAFDAEQAGNTHFLVMEFVEGVSLAKRVQDGGPLPVPEACRCVCEAALGLQHAFEQGMVHRDVKPHNLMLTPAGQVKILDFGLARFVRETWAADGLTQEGAVMGTPDYLAPEQAQDAHAADARADIYSLGCTLYFLLTGRPPFPGGSFVQKLAAHQSAVPRPVREFRPEVPPELVRVLERMLAKRPQDRYQTPAEVAAALAPFLCTPTAAPAGPSPPRRRRWLPWAAAAVAALVLLLGVAVYRITTDFGVVEIETHDDRVEVVISQNGKRVAILDGQTKRRIELRSGSYEVKLADGKNELTLTTGDFVLKRGATEIVRVRRVGLAKAPMDTKPGLQGSAAPDLRGRKPLFHDDFHDRASGFMAGKKEPSVEMGYVDGKYVIAFRAGGGWWYSNCPGGRWENFACEVVGRVARDPADRWGLRMMSRHGHGVKVALDGEGCVRVGRFSGEGDNNREPLVDTVRHLPMRRGREFNKLLVVLRGRLLEVYVNGTAVCDPIKVDQGLTPALLALQCFTKNKEGGVEFAEITVWSADKLPPPGQQPRVPADSLNPKTIPPYELAAAGDGDPKAAPPELVAILGDSRLRHWNGIETIAFSPDGKTMATGSSDQTVRLWDAAKGTQLAVFDGHRTRVHRLAFSPDGKTLASGADEPNVLLWDVAKKRRKMTLVGHLSWITDLAFHRDGKMLATVTHAQNDRRVILWDLDTGKPIADWVPHRQQVMSVAFSPDGTLLATGGEDDRLIKLWDWKTRKLLRELKGHSAELCVRSLAFHPDGATLLSADMAGMVRLWDVASGEERTRIAVNPGWASGVFSPDGKRLALWCLDGTVFLYDGAGKRLLRKRRASNYIILTAAAFTPDSKTLALGSWEAEVKWWDFEADTFRPHPGSAMEALFCVAVSPDGRSVASASQDGTVRVWDLQTGKVRYHLKEHTLPVFRVAFSPDGQILASAGRDATVCLWEMTSGKLKHQLKGHTGQVEALAFSPDGTRLVSGSTDATAILWDVPSGTYVRAFREHKGTVESLVFSPDGKQVLTTGRSETGVFCWDAATGRRQRGLEGEPHGIALLAFHPEGGLLITGGNRGSDWRSFHVWDYPTRKKLRTVEHHSFLVNAVAFAPDGTAVSTACDGTVCLWNPQTGVLKCPPIRVGPYGGWVCNAVFTPEGRHLVVANRNGTIYVLRLTPPGK